MQAVVLEKHGGPEVLTLREVPDPAPGPEEVLVAVTATAVNRADLLQRMGLYPGPPGEHEIPGMEFAGRVAARGRAGHRLVGGRRGHGHRRWRRLRRAARASTSARSCRCPPELGLADAAAMPEVFLTA